MKKLKTALIGLGRIGWQYHAPKITAHPGFDFAAAVDPLPERLQEAQEKWGIRGYTNLTEMLAAEKPELVVIASPTHFHKEHALTAFESGADVFCDKPVATSLQDTDDMIAAMQRHGRKLMVYQPHRADTATVALREILSQGLLGDVFLHKRTACWYSRRNDWQAYSKHGGGMLFNYGAHYVDQALSIAGTPFKRLSCSMRALVTVGDADDFVKLLAETQDGTVMDIEINMAAAQSPSPWRVYGTRGSMVLDCEDGSDATKAATEKLRWNICYVPADEMPTLTPQQGLAAQNRRYGAGETIPWRTLYVPLADVEPISFYQKCYEYYALDAEPFVPISQTREVMRVLEQARADAGWND